MSVRPRRSLPLIAVAVVASVFIACASPGGGTADQTAPAPARARIIWPVKTREHVDLWLHGFAMLTDDTARVPYFQRGYRDAMIVRRNQRNVTTTLDANREALRQRLTINPRLGNAQFVALYFGTWEEFIRFVELFQQANGDPRAASNPEVARGIAVLAEYFTSPADREWLRLFLRSLDDERTRFYQDYWVSEQARRAATLAAVDSLWQTRYRLRLQRFLNNTQQESGDILLSLPLNGEGRTIAFSSRENLIAVGFPEQPANAIEAIYVIAHEAVNNIANQAVADNTTPAERQRGVDARYASAGLVRGGALLLAKVAPELTDGYARYYLRAAGITPSGDPNAQLSAAFPLPQIIRDAIASQIEIVIGGI